MQKATYLICFFLYVTLCSSDCNKKTTTPDPIPEVINYQPDASGSEWNYATTGTNGGAAVNSSYKLTATSRDSVANAKTYKVFTNSVGPNEYYNKSGNDYYRITAFPGLGQFLEVLHLKDNTAIGSSWTDTKNVTVSGIPVTVVSTFTIAEKGIDHVVNGVTFKNVIKVNVSLALTAFGSPVPLDPSSSIQYFYANKIGMINNKVIIKIPLGSIDVNTETKLGSYTIK